MVRKLYGIKFYTAGTGDGQVFANVRHSYLSNSKYIYKIDSNKTYSFRDIVLNNTENNFLLSVCKTIITIN